MASPSSSASPSSWVILGSIPCISAPAYGDDLSPQHFPFVLAADPSGLLLLQANLGCPMSCEVLDRPGHQSVQWKDSTSRYFVLDATAASAFHLPDPQPANTILHQAPLGLLVAPGGGGHYMVAELQPIIGSDEATLLCFSTEVGEWVGKRFHYPLEPRPLAPVCVVSHHSRLWWVDLSWGVIHTDPFADKPVLGFVPFQPGRVLECREGWGVTDQYRYVGAGVSGGKLRFVDTYMSTRACGGGTPKVSVSTLAGPDSTEWTLEHEATFLEIWADKSYKATRLPKKVPFLALIHPKNTRVVSFFLEKHLFGVDVRARKVVECKVYCAAELLPRQPLRWCLGAAAAATLRHA